MHMSPITNGNHPPPATGKDTSTTVRALADLSLLNGMNITPTAITSPYKIAVQYANKRNAMICKLNESKHVMWLWCLA